MDTENFRGKTMELGQGDGIKVDLKDMKILAAIGPNARIPYSRLAKLVGLSKDSVRYRIEKLKRMDVIRENLLLVNPFKFNMDCNTIFLRLENMKPEDEGRIISYFVNHPFVIWFSQCTGQWDFVVIMNTKNIIHFKMELRKIKEVCKGHFKDYMHLIHMAWMNYNNVPKKMINDVNLPCIPVKSDSSFEKDLNRPVALISEKSGPPKGRDIKILRALAQDCTKSISDIARTTNISRDDVKYRIRKMIREKVIMSFLPIINLSFLGYYAYILLIETVPGISEEREKELEQYIYSHPNVAYSLKTSEKWDYEIPMIVKSPLDFHYVLKEFRNQFSDVIESFESLLLIKDYKFNFLPEGLRSML